jgi:3-oxoadipate enol-lactonase
MVPATMTTMATMVTGIALVRGCRLSYDIEGPEAAPACLLLHSLGTTSELWSPQRERFRHSFRVIRYDVRGHGRSQPAVGPYTLDQLGRDALAVLDAAGVERAHVCGVSLGGLTALWLAVHAPDRVGRIVAANTAARLGTKEAWSERIEVARTGGMAAVLNGGLARWFTDRFRERDPDTVEKFRSMLQRCRVDGYVGACAVLRDADLRQEISRISAETLVVTGRHDTATPPALGELIRSRVAAAQVLELDAAHLSNVEQAASFTAGVLDFLRG